MNAGQRDLSGTVVLVTGAGAGIGAATVRMLVAEGACVVAADRDAVAAAEVVAGLPSEQVLTHAMDVRSADDARQGVAAAMDRWVGSTRSSAMRASAVSAASWTMPTSTSQPSSTPT